MSASGTQPPGTFLPNTKVTCGSHKVYIEKYLSEGGFAHVYVVRIPRENNRNEIAVLKRVAVPDKEHLANMRTEVETMKKLRGHKHIVTYIDSHASQLKGGGYEVFLLMEYCSGGGLIDFMNTRLQHRLTEPEILKIFGDCAEGVACMHYLKPPLLHRDLKVENVLIAKSSSGNPTYKVCDFGSSASPRPAAKTAEEGRMIEEDVQKHTTMQYRSPEMIDVWRKQPIDEKSDIWALGVLLYKLCYYTTPFEDVGQMAILNASFKYPSYPTFSDRIKKLIAWMLKEDPRQRPNIHQVVKEICSMRGTEVPIKDIYANRTQSEAQNNESLPLTGSRSAAVGLQKTAPVAQVQVIPEVAPMRRGRPPAPGTQAASTTKPSPSPARGDPFAALDSKNFDVRAGAVDQLSQRFPSLDEFSIAHDGGKFAFPTSPPLGSPPVPNQKESLSDRVAQALADEVFAAKSPPASTTTIPKSGAQNLRPTQGKQSAPPKLQQPVSIKQQQPTSITQQPTVPRSGVVYKSTAVGSSPPLLKRMPEVSNRPIWRVPEHHRSTSQPRALDAVQTASTTLQPPAQRPGLLEVNRTTSQAGTLKSSSSSRPSLEGGRPSALDLQEVDLSRTKSLTSRSRPNSLYVSSNLDYLRDQEQSRKRPSMEIRRHSRQPSQSRESGAEESAIEDDMDYLRSTEDQDGGQRKSMKEAMRLSGHHRKRSSLDAIRSGTKNILGGRLGDAFKRFEHNDPRSADHDSVTPDALDYDEPQLLSPITGSEATPPRKSEIGSAFDETEDLPPDVKREIERRRLSQEERRVAEAAAEYRARVANQESVTSAPPTRASTIQKRVQSLLDEGRQSNQPRKTAEGYGRYTDSIESNAPDISTQPSIPQPSGTRPPVASRKPNVMADPAILQYPPTRQQPVSIPPAGTLPVASSAPVEITSLQRANSRPGPSAPPKPKALRTGGSAPWPPPQSSNVEKPRPPKSAGLAALLAKDLEGVPDYPARAPGNATSSPDHPTMSGLGEDDLDSFSKRYPSLSGIEMVETEIGH